MSDALKFTGEYFIPGRLPGALKTITRNVTGSLLQEAGFSVSKSEVYRQRQQVYLPNRLLRGVYNRDFRPGKRTSPELTPVRRLMPRYVVVMAHKA